MYLQKFRLSAVVAAIALGACAAAAAAPVVVNANIANGAYLNNGTYNGWFSSGAPEMQTPFIVNSASFSFSFNDDVDALMVESSYYNGSWQTGYQYTGSTWNGVTTQNYTNTLHDTYRVGMGEAGESAGVTLGLARVASGAGATAATISSSDTSQYQGTYFTSRQSYPGYSYSCGNRCSGYQPGYNRDYYSQFFKDSHITTRQQNGAFVVAGSISDAGLLQELTSQRMLNFSLNVGGDLYLTSAQLNLDITADVPGQATDVPEPSSLMLMFGALGALGFAARRRRK